MHGNNKTKTFLGSSSYIYFFPKKEAMSFVGPSFCQLSRYQKVSEAEQKFSLLLQMHGWWWCVDWSAISIIKCRYARSDAEEEGGKVHVHSFHCVQQ